MLKLLCQVIYICIGVGCLYMLSHMLQEMWCDLCEYIELKKEDQERDYEYRCEVIEDPETGQRTSTIIR